MKIKPCPFCGMDQPQDPFERFGKGGIGCSNEKCPTNNYDFQGACFMSIEEYNTRPLEDKLMETSHKDYQGMREFQEKFMKADHERLELLEALADCVNVLNYIGAGVSAHSMAKEFASRHRHLLTEEVLHEASGRIIAWENDLTPVQALPK